MSCWKSLHLPSSKILVSNFVLKSFGLSFSFKGHHFQLNMGSPYFSLRPLSIPTNSVLDCNVSAEKYNNIYMAVFVHEIRHFFRLSHTFSMDISVPHSFFPLKGYSFRLYAFFSATTPIEYEDPSISFLWCRVLKCSYLRACPQSFRLGAGFCTCSLAVCKGSLSLSLAELERAREQWEEQKAVGEVHKALQEPLAPQRGQQLRCPKEACGRLPDGVHKLFSRKNPKMVSIPWINSKVSQRSQPLLSP